QRDPAGPGHARLHVHGLDLRAHRAPARGRAPDVSGRPVGGLRHTGRMIGFIIAGLIIGALARLIKPGKQNLGILATLGLGLVGSVIGGLIASFLGTGSIWELNILGFILAVVASVLLIGVAEGITSGNNNKQINA